MTDKNMPNKKFSIAELTAQYGRKSKQRQLEDLREQIEGAISAGIPYERIVQGLAEQEVMTISLNAFKVMLNRMRSKQKSPKGSQPGKGPHHLQTTISHRLNASIIPPSSEGAHGSESGTMSWNDLKKLPINF
jgi:hypothetical protein